MPESAIVAAVRRAAARVPDRPALIAGETRISYAELERRAAAAAAAVADKARGDIVGLFLPNSPAFVWSLLGALQAGKTVAVLPTLAPPPLLALMAAEAGLETVITAGELAPRLAESKAAPLLVEQMAAGAGRPSCHHGSLLALLAAGLAQRFDAPRIAPWRSVSIA